VEVWYSVVDATIDRRIRMGESGDAVRTRLANVLWSSSSKVAKVCFSLPVPGSVAATIRI